MESAEYSNVRDHELVAMIKGESERLLPLVNELLERGYEVSVHCFAKGDREKPKFSVTCKKELKV